MPIPRPDSSAAFDVRAGPADAVFLGCGLHDFHNSEPPAGALFLASLFIPADIGSNLLYIIAEIPGTKWKAGYHKL